MTIFSHIYASHPWKIISLNSEHPCSQPFLFYFVPCMVVKPWQLTLCGQEQNSIFLCSLVMQFLACFKSFFVFFEESFLYKWPKLSYFGSNPNNFNITGKPVHFMNTEWKKYENYGSEKNVRTFLLNWVKTNQWYFYIKFYWKLRNDLLYITYVLFEKKKNEVQLNICETFPSNTENESFCILIDIIIKYDS